jgi:Protein of unknown function (DUF2281)
MGTPERIYELIKAMPADQANEVLDFVEFLSQKAQLKSEIVPPSGIPKGILTGLRGIAKGSGIPLTDEEIREEYTDYLIQKYQ